MKKVLIAVGVLAIVFIVCVGVLMQSGMDRIDTQSDTRQEETVTKAEYDAVKTGMSYSQVSAIIGFDGEEQSRNQIMDITTVMYDWRNDDLSGMNAIFQNDKLTQKSQFMLK